MNNALYDLERELRNTEYIPVLRTVWAQLAPEQIYNDSYATAKLTCADRSEIHRWFGSSAKINAITDKCLTGDNLTDGEKRRLKNFVIYWGMFPNAQSTIYRATQKTPNKIGCVGDVLDMTRFSSWTYNPLTLCKFWDNDNPTIYLIRDGCGKYVGGIPNNCYGRRGDIAGDLQNSEEEVICPPGQYRIIDRYTMRVESDGFYKYRTVTVFELAPIMSYMIRRDMVISSDTPDDTVHVPQSRFGTSKQF